MSVDSTRLQPIVPRVHRFCCHTQFLAVSRPHDMFLFSLSNLCLSKQVRPCFIIWVSLGVLFSSRYREYHPYFYSRAFLSCLPYPCGSKLLHKWDISYDAFPHELAGKQASLAKRAWYALCRQRKVCDYCTVIQDILKSGCSLTPLTHSLAPLTRSLARSLTRSWSRGTVGYFCQIF